MSNTDLIQRFYFAGQPFRGAIVKLQNSFIEALNGHNYPSSINALLGESLTASVLMGIHLKHNARLSLQARGDGPIKLLMAEAVMQQAADTNEEVTQHKVRAVARLSEETPPGIESDSQALQHLLGRGQLAITIEPEEGERYQGIVGADQENLSQCLEAYFNQSEQLPTLFQLATSDTAAAGILLQRMPHNDNYQAGDNTLNSNDIWEELIALTGTLTDRELLEVPVEKLLFNLFHEHQVKLSPPDTIQFECSCSYQRTGAALMQISPLEIESILEADQEIVMDCEFCSARYRFNRKDIDNLGQQSNETRH
ncbi:MAG TPA: redox-regulated molecular chaperone Hsp33 [Cellvibrionales bacterium]|jgi:molecular chaperone Hsp33|nr:redox-regulated molecular chaperone Hsp33 [Cellvibrionales bacterium]HAW13737.1 redox-regulated molecular chaperone Hsp33 [Cellvibrionales bacterium]